MNNLRKLAWQRSFRLKFKTEHGYSDVSHYATGGLRGEVLLRDGYRCVRCGMTDHEHKQRWNRPITVDHIDKNRKNNTMGNLQTLCLPCHGNKDLIQSLRQQRIAIFREEIITRRNRGESYQTIADSLGFSPMGIWKWAKRWEKSA